MLTSGGNLYSSNLMAILDQDVDLDQDTKKFVLSYAGDQATSLKKKMQEKALTSITSSLVISENGAAAKVKRREDFFMFFKIFLLFLGCFSTQSFDQQFGFKSC